MCIRDRAIDERIAQADDAQRQAIGEIGGLPGIEGHRVGAVLNAGGGQDQIDTCLLYTSIHPLSHELVEDEQRPHRFQICLLYTSGIAWSGRWSCPTRG